MDIQTLRAYLSYCPDTGIFIWNVPRNKLKSGTVAGSLNAKGYQYIHVLGKSYRANRLAWFYVNGSWPVGQVDHINGNRSDNRIANLRDVDSKTNQRNRKASNRSNASGLLGVSWNSANRNWRAQISVGRKTLYLGSFQDKNEARSAYLSAKERLHAAT